VPALPDESARLREDAACPGRYQVPYRPLTRETYALDHGQAGH